MLTNLRSFSFVSGVFRPFGKLVYRFGRHNSGTQKTFSRFIFPVVIYRKYVEIAINYFSVHLIAVFRSSLKCKNAGRREEQRNKEVEGKKTVNESVFIHLTA